MNGPSQPLPQSGPCSDLQLTGRLTTHQQAHNSQAGSQLTGRLTTPGTSGVRIMLVTQAYTSGLRLMSVARRYHSLALYRSSTTRTAANLCLGTLLRTMPPHSVDCCVMSVCSGLFESCPQERHNTARRSFSVGRGRPVEAQHFSLVHPGRVPVQVSISTSL